MQKMHESGSFTDCDDGLRIRGDEDTRDAHAHRARYRFAAEMLAGSTRVLDFGCGTGYGARILASTCEFVHGHDPPLGHYAELQIPNFYDAVVAFEVLEHLDAPPLATLMSLEKLAPVVIASVPYLEHAGQNRHHRWARLQESNFPGRRIAYQYADGTISRMPGQAQNLIICSFKHG